MKWLLMAVGVAAALILAVAVMGGYHATIDEYLRSLGSKFGESAVLEN